MAEEITPTKQKEVLYLICFLAQAGFKPTIPRAQQTLREALGLWSITTEDIATYWPQTLHLHRHTRDKITLNLNGHTITNRKS